MKFFSRALPISSALALAFFSVLLPLAFLCAPQAHALIPIRVFDARRARAKARELRLKHRHPPKKHRFTVVLDPGHGGIDDGTSYHGNPPVYEKDLTLMLARQVRLQLLRRGIHVIMTRNQDVAVPLAARTALANKVKADVFLSIHLNSSPARDPDLAEGTETYILNHETESTSKRLAQLENEVIGGAPKTPQGEDVALILKDMRLDANLPESKRLACMIQSRVAHLDPRTKKAHYEVTSNRGVKQAMFFVLLGADMPSALIEAGFLSNPYDRAWLLSLKGQREFGLAVARAINLFRLEKNTAKARRILSTCQVH